MARTLVKGNTGLAEKLGVSVSLVQKWRRLGTITDAVAAETGRVIIYDLDLVLECISQKPVNKGGRPWKDSFKNRRI